MTHGPCPEPSTLRAILDGDLPAPEQQALAEHLEGCPACRDRLEDLAAPTRIVPSDTAEPLAPATAASFAPSPERIRAWQDLAATLDGVRARRASVDVIVERLQPPQEDGEIARIGPYRVNAVLGHGGMGVVLLASDPALRRPVAIKVLRPELAAEAPARERFLREARAAAAVQHDHVVLIHAVESEGDLPYLVMEYVPGGTLQGRLDDAGPLPLPELTRLGAQVAEGLAAAHAQGLVHRDVKPANILIDERTGRAKLGDFGLARRDDDPALTQVGFVVGTPHYLAPEQAYGRATDHRADLYALGATLYAAATGSPPLPDASTRKLARRTDREASGSRVARAPAIPPGLSRLIEQLLRSDPEERPGSASEVAAALRRLESTGSRSRRLGWAAASVAACGLLAGAGWLASRSRREPAPVTRPIASPSTIVAAQPEGTGHFVRDGSQRFPTLEEAVRDARGGSVIEIRGNGPYRTGPLRLGDRDITIRAGAGMVPVLELIPGEGDDSAPGIVADAGLTLEGLSIRSSGVQTAISGMDPADFSVVVARGGPLRAAHCRFEVGPRSACVALVRGPGEFLGCQFLAAEGLALSWAPGAGQTLRLADTLLANYNGVVVDLARSEVGSGQATLRIEGSTIRATSAIRIHGAVLFYADVSPESPRLTVGIESEGSVFDAEHLFVLLNSPGYARMADERRMATIARNFRDHFSWKGTRNLYSIATSWLSHANRGQPPRPFRLRPRNLGEWERFWDGSEAGSAMARLAFRGSIAAADPAGHALAPRDVEKWARDGRPPGAPIDRTGPGPAHDAWRTSRASLDRAARP